MTTLQASVKVVAEPAKRKERAERKQRAAHARPGTVAADQKITIEDAPLLDSIVVSRKEHGPAQNRYNSDVSNLPLIIRQTSRERRVRVWRTSDGRWWRKGGDVAIRRWAGEGGEHSEGERAFVLTLYKGANLGDLDYLRSFVAEARGEGVSRSLWHHVRAEWADRETFSLDASRIYGDPHTQRDPLPGIWFCDDVNCPATWHLEHEDHEHDDISNGDYSIVIWKDRKASAKWLLSITVDSCGLDSRVAASLVNDIQWMQQTCDKLNAPAEVTA